MPGGSKGPGVRGLEDKAARIAAAVSSKPTVDQFYALKGDLELLNSSIQQENCSGQQLTAVLASRIPADLARTAMAGLELLGNAGSATSEAAKNLSGPLDSLGRPLMYCVSGAAATGGKISVPTGFLASWAVAAAPAAAYLQQHSQESPPTATTRAVLSTAVALLRMWRIAAMQQLAARGSTAAAAPTSHVVTTMPIAADLSVLLLTSPAAAAAFAQEVQVMAAGQASVKYLQFTAATTLHIMSSLVAYAGKKVMGPQHPVLPPAFAHDSVQRALVLHLAACMPYCVQQMAQQQNKPSSSKKAAGSSKAPSASTAAAADATAREVLQQLGFQRLQDVLQYGRVACDAAGVAPGPPDGDTPRGHLASAYGGIQLAFVLRRQAMGHPQWPDLYKGAITRPSPLATQLAVDPLLAPVMAPGVDSLLLLELLLQLVIVLGPSDEVSMSATLGIGINSLQPATSRMADTARVAKCLQLMWLGVGRDLLAAAGVGGAELDADTEEGVGGSSSGSSSTQQQHTAAAADRWVDD